MKLRWMIVLLASACSAPQSSGDSSGEPPAEPVVMDAGLADAAGDASALPVAKAPEFPLTIEVKRFPFGILGPTDLIERSDGRAYVLLASAQGTKTGRPMAIVDLETGDIEQTSAVPIPLSRPYGVRLGGDDLFVWSESRNRNEPDLVYVDAVFYDASSDLWHVVPLPGGERMRSIDVEQDSSGAMEASIWTVGDAETKRWSFDPASRKWTELPPYEPEGCMAVREPDGDKTWAAGLRVEEGTPPCAALLEGDKVTPLPPPPTPRCLHRVARSNDATWLIGGYASCGTTLYPSTDRVDRLSDGGAEWQNLPDLPISVVPAGVAFMGGHMLVFDHELGVSAWVEASGAWSRTRPIEDYDNNSDWVVIAPNRVATLSWRKEPNRRDDEVVVYTFGPVEGQ